MLRGHFNHVLTLSDLKYKFLVQTSSCSPSEIFATALVIFLVTNVSPFIVERETKFKSTFSENIQKCHYSFAAHLTKTVCIDNHLYRMSMNLISAVLRNFVFDWEMCFRLCAVHRFHNLVSFELPIKHTINFISKVIYL